MDTLSPLQTMYDAEGGVDLPLPPELRRLYGRLAFPMHESRAHVISDFVQTIDGVVTLGIPGHEGGGDISGHSREDLMVLGLLRAVADAIIITPTSLRVGGNHPHTAPETFPPLAHWYQSLRSQLGKSSSPVHVVVTGSGRLPVDHGILKGEEVPVLVVTTKDGAQVARDRGLAPKVPIVPVQAAGEIDARAILDAIRAHISSGSPLLLSEGGPHLFGTFLAANCLNELFLTVAPQIAGRDKNSKRPGLVSDHLFAPDDSRWVELISAKRGTSYLFLRYRFGSRQ